MSKSPTCDVCSKNLTNPPKILMTSDMDRIYHCPKCQIIICTECEGNFVELCYEILNSEDEDGYYGGHVMATCTSGWGRHHFSSFTICQYCGKIVDDYDHIENVHHYIKCKGCSIIMKDREEQTKHLYNNQNCLDRYFSDGHSSLIKMLMKNIQTLQKEINKLKRYSKNKKSSRNFKTEQINRCDEKYLRKELCSKHNTS